MSCTIVFNFFKSGQSLTLRLEDASGGMVNGTVPDAFSEPDPETIPGRYTATVAESLEGWSLAKVSDAAGVLYLGSVKVANDGGTYLIDDPRVLDKVTIVPTVQQIREELDANSTKLVNLDATVSSRSTLSAAQVWAHATATAMVSAIGTITSQVGAIFGKLPTSSRLAGSANADGSIEVEVGDVTIEGDVNVASFRSTALAQLAGRIITVSMPALVNNQLNVPIIRGDAYSAEIGNAIELSNAAWPDLPEGTTILLTAVQKRTGQSFTAAGTVVTSTGAKVIRIELTPTQTQAFAAGIYQFSIVATIPDADAVHLVGPETTLRVLNGLS